MTSAERNSSLNSLLISMRYPTLVLSSLQKLKVFRCPSLHMLRGYGRYFTSVEQIFILKEERYQPLTLLRDLVALRHVFVPAGLFDKINSWLIEHLPAVSCQKWKADLLHEEAVIHCNWEEVICISMATIVITKLLWARATWECFTKKLWSTSSTNVQ